MNYRQITFMLLILVLGFAEIVKACTCDTPSLGFAIYQSENIVVAKLNAVEKYQEGEKGAFSGGIWKSQICSRSNWSRGAAADLMYLEKMDKLKGKSRLYGVVAKFIESSLEGEYPKKTFLEGFRVRVLGKGRDITLRTDKNGVYEIYGLPRGKYKVIPDKVPGFKLEDGEEWEEAELYSSEDISDADFRFEIENSIEGRVLDSDAKPVSGACIDAIPYQGIKSKHFRAIDCAKDDGQFRISNIPPGTYILTINRAGDTAEKEPPSAVYYPKTKNRNEAGLITIGPGDHLKGLDITFLD